MTFTPQNTFAVVIVHGQSEYALISAIKSKLKVNVEIFSRHKGRESIQIDGLTHILKNDVFKSRQKLLKKYPNINNISDFKIFTFMDTDDCTDESIRKNYIDGHLSSVNDHPLKEYFCPIYCDGNLEDVLSDIEFSFVPKSNKDKKKYLVVFDSDKQIANEESIRDFCNKLKKSQKTNLDILIEFILKHANKLDEC